MEIHLGDVINIEEYLKLGNPMLPREREVLLRYDGPLIGTFKVGENTILFWAADTFSDPVMRYAYAVLTDEEVAQLGSYFRDAGGYKSHPLLTGRRVVVGLSDTQWALARVVAIECGSENVFDEIDQLLPVS